jgi:homoserine O-acetyltransferase
MRLNPSLLAALGAAAPTLATSNSTTGPLPPPSHGDFAISNFTFNSGETLDLTLHYQTMGSLQTNADGSTNAILLLHGSTMSGSQFLEESFADTLFQPGQPLDASKYFLVMPDHIGHGNSSKPSTTGLRANFPSYQYADMVRANHLLLTSHLGVNHTRLVLGVSLGGMQTWMLGEEYPDFSDALMPISCLPVQIGGQNRLWRKFSIELIRSDPAWKDGNYETQPFAGLAGLLAVTQVMGSDSLYYQREYATRDAVDAYVDMLLPLVPTYDANDLLYQWNASFTYDPEPRVAEITTPLTAVNTADDLMNPPELKILERVVEKQMKRGVGKAVVVPRSEETFGHGTYIAAKVWEEELLLLLATTEKSDY